MANCMSGLHGAMKMGFSDGCAKVGVIMPMQRNCCRELHHCGASTWFGSRFRVFVRMVMTDDAFISTSRALSHRVCDG